MKDPDVRDPGDIKRAAFFIILLSAAIIFGCGFFMTRPETGIVRINDPQKIPLVFNGTKEPVAYLDYREKEAITIYYDRDGKGKLQTLGTVPRSWWPDHFGYDTAYLQTVAWYKITSVKEAEERNAATSPFSGNLWLAEKTETADSFQEAYKEVRDRYKEQNPEATEFAENQPYVEPPVVSKVRPDALNKFQTLFSLFRIESEAEERAANGKPSERVQLRAYKIFGYAASAYHNLNDDEKDAFIGEQVSCGIRFRLKGSGEPNNGNIYFFSTLGPAVKPLKDSFEYTFFNIYIEVDYMSGWSLTDKERGQIEQELNRELMAQGLITAES